MTVCVHRTLLWTIGSLNHYFYELNLISYYPMQFSLSEKINFCQNKWQYGENRLNWFILVLENNRYSIGNDARLAEQEYTGSYGKSQMKSTQLREELCKLAHDYAKNRNLRINDAHKTAILFEEIQDSFLKASYDKIIHNEQWSQRLKKPHSNASGYFEMQSSNSSDALLMNIFCHPQFLSWKGIQDLFCISSLENPVFGFMAKVELTDRREDETEIDLACSDIFIEAKLTEKDFTQKDASIVLQYTGLKEHFHEEALSRNGQMYDNYQVIRNLLATIQHNKRHILICDERRTDLTRKYMETVSCLRDVTVRQKCKVIFWQEIAASCGNDLKVFLKDKYGIY